MFQIGQTHLDHQCGLMRTYRDFAPLKKKKLFSVFHPEYLQKILIHNAENYDKEDFTYHAAIRTIGSSILTDTDYETWHRKRRILQPFFKPIPCSQHQGFIVHNTLAQLQQWEHYAKDAKSFVLTDALRQLVINSSQKILLGENFNGSQLIDSFSTVLNRYLHRNYFRTPWLPTPTNFRYHRLLRKFQQTLRATIQQPEHSTFVDLLLSCHDPKNSLASHEQQTISELITFLITSYESTASALFWVFERLERNPGIYQALQNELQSIDKVEDLAHVPLKQLDLCSRIFKEIIRLYPVVWIFGRRAIQADQLGPHHIAAGDSIMICPYAIHRHPDYWHKPEAFMPDRFLPENDHLFPHDCYLPFGAGSRVCIGMNLALLQGTLLIAIIAKKFQLKLIKANFASPDPLLFLRVKNQGLARVALPTALVSV
jgi:cytochrome P450